MLSIALAQNHVALTQQTAGNSFVPQSRPLQDMERV